MNGGTDVPIYDLRITNYDLENSRASRGLCNVQALAVGKITRRCYEESSPNYAKPSHWLCFHRPSSIVHVTFFLRIW